MVEPRPSVSVAIPVYNGAAHLERCLAAIAVQTYENICEVLVVDGGSSDGTRELVAATPLVRVVDNPRRNRPAAMNIALAEAAGDVIVRVDGRTFIAPDYVERCVVALGASQATIVGGPMRLTAETARQRGIRAAMMSKLGGGPAEFRRDRGGARYVDTVYLGAFYRDAITAIGGYDEVFGGNEDAELAYRAQQADGVYLDPAIHSSYAVRDGFGALWTQYVRYGRARAGTIRKHPGSLAPRQLVVPAFFVALASPWQRPVLAAYSVAIVGRSVQHGRVDRAAAIPMMLAFPTMHLAWGVGFAKGFARRRRPEADADAKSGR
jgi:glycosyltransferase involved in cell wall biosynthesis